MLCKFCGMEIQDGQVSCQSCDEKANKTNSGNGFWDIAKKVPDTETAAPAPGKSRYTLNIVCAVFCVLCLTAGIITGVVAYQKANNAMDEAAQYENQYLLAQEYIEELENRENNVKENDGDVDYETTTNGEEVTEESESVEEQTTTTTARITTTTTTTAATKDEDTTTTTNSSQDSSGQGDGTTEPSDDTTSDSDLNEDVSSDSDTVPTMDIE